MLGLAVDFDARRLYRRRDGTWLGGSAPGDPKGTTLPTRGPYAAEVSSDVPLEPLLDAGVVRINFGSAPFQRQMPAGYLAFDAEVSRGQGRAASRPVATYEPDERVAGETQAQWVRRYWEWSRSFAPAENPSMDKTGHRCGAGQFGPVWFLTGSREPDAIQRECEVPEGRILLVPIINSLVQANVESDVPCERLVVALRQLEAGATALRFELNGFAVPEPNHFRVATGCFRLLDASAGNSLAAGSGYWVFVKPLPTGRHELAFGAKHPGTRFQQDIKYVLHVR